MLFRYAEQVTRFIHDSKQEKVNLQDIFHYVNQARREIAQRCECIRFLTPSQGGIVSGTIVNGGTNYSAPTAVITPPDFPSGALPDPNGRQAAAVLTQTGGTIDSVQIVDGGSGYFQPTMQIVDPTGSGAVVNLVTTSLSTIVQGQEVIDGRNLSLATQPGVKYIHNVRAISVIYADYRYSIPVYPFTVYQAKIRQFPFQYQYVPSIGGQLGQGSYFTYFLYPLASNTYQLEFDCQGTPQDLLTDADYEAIPEPWPDAIPFYATHLAFLELGNYNAARVHLDLFNEFAHRKSAYARIGRVVNPYGRY